MPAFIRLRNHTLTETALTSTVALCRDPEAEWRAVQQSLVRGETRLVAVLRSDRTEASLRDAASKEQTDAGLRKGQHSAQVAE